MNAVVILVTHVFGSQEHTKKVNLLFAKEYIVISREVSG
jgi:hypothetical protein